MAQFSGNAIWPSADPGRLAPMINIVYDPLLTGFRPMTTSDTSYSNSGGLINTNVTGTVQVNGLQSGSFPINISGFVNANIKPANTFNSPSNFAISGSGKMGTALASNAARKALFIQNIGLNPLFVKFGTVGASDSSMSMILGGGTLSGDGKGGSFIDEGCQVTGLVDISGVQPNYLVWEA